MSSNSEIKQDEKQAASTSEDAFTPNSAAVAELDWFFNEAESAIDQPSNYLAIAGVFPTSAGAVEDRAEARHAAEKILGWLEALPPGFAALLESLYTQRVMPGRVTNALGIFAGVVEDSVSVRMEFVRTAAAGSTETHKVRVWFEELIQQGKTALLEQFRREARRQCALAHRAYEHVRGPRPSVVPGSDEDER
jgi:hypothetical protein